MGTQNPNSNSQATLAVAVSKNLQQHMSFSSPHPLLKYAAVDSYDVKCVDSGFVMESDGKGIETRPIYLPVTELLDAPTVREPSIYAPKLKPNADTTPMPMKYLLSSVIGFDLGQDVLQVTAPPPPPKLKEEEVMPKVTIKRKAQKSKTASNVLAAVSAFSTVGKSKKAIAKKESDESPAVALGGETKADAPTSPAAAATAIPLATVVGPAHSAMAVAALASQQKAASFDYIRNYAGTSSDIVERLRAKKVEAEAKEQAKKLEEVNKAKGEAKVAEEAKEAKAAAEKLQAEEAKAKQLKEEEEAALVIQGLVRARRGRKVLALKAKEKESAEDTLASKPKKTKEKKKAKGDDSTVDKAKPVSPKAASPKGTAKPSDSVASPPNSHVEESAGASKTATGKLFHQDTINDMRAFIEANQKLPQVETRVASPKGAATKEAVAAALMSFYSEVKPSKATTKNCKEQAAAYIADVPEMIRLLVKKYGEEPVRKHFDAFIPPGPIVLTVPATIATPTSTKVIPDSPAALVHFKRPMIPSKGRASRTGSSLSTSTHAATASESMLAALQEKFRKDWKDTTVKIDLVRLAARADVSFASDSSPLPEIKVEEGLAVDASSLATANLVHRLDYFFSGKSEERRVTRETDIKAVLVEQAAGLETAIFVEKLIMGSDPRTISVLKMFTQGVVLLGTEILKSGVTSTLPTRDVRDSDGWRVVVSLAKDSVEVAHRKKEQTSNTIETEHFWLQWELRMRFDGEMKDLKSATLRMIDVGMHDSISTELRNKLGRLIIRWMIIA